MSSGKPPIGIVHYQLIDEVENQHKRFQAFIHDKYGSHPLSVKNWALLLSIGKDSSHLIQQFNNVLKDVSSVYNAFFFETKGVSSFNASEKQFEFVLVNAESLYRFTRGRGAEGYDSFSEHLDCPSETTCCAFPNLTRSSVLIAPKPQSDQMNFYTDLASFVKNTSGEEATMLWQMVTREYIKALDMSPSQSRWLSTSGTGVPWLHVRIDNTPKYYTFAEFKKDH